MLSTICIVLVNPSHPGNIGASARAMKNMGITQLRLVNPEDFPSDHARARASGADDILDNATIYDSLPAALQDCHVIYATSARSRHLDWSNVTPRECGEQVANAKTSQTAIVFGCERSGLSNEELALSHYHVQIPTNPEFSSLNLAAAVQLICYELRLAQLDSSTSSLTPTNEIITAGQLYSLYEHFERTLTQLEFLDPKQPKLLMQRLQRLLSRAQLQKKEYDILRGILSAVDRKLR